MSKTAFLGLPLVQPSQAQKHVTVNEALTRIDALTQLTILSTSLQSPPAATEGDCYFVAPGGVNAWSGQDGTLALYLNGGWDFVSPGIGWHAWLVDLGTPAMFDGVDWVPGTGAISLNGAATTGRVIEIDHDLMAGPSSATVPIIPAQSLVIGVTGIVLTAITGAATTWQLGIGGVSPDRYGSGLGTAAGSWVRGLTSSPLAYYAATPLTITGEGGDLSGGQIRLAVHVTELTLPRG